MVYFVLLNITMETFGSGLETQVQVNTMGEISQHFLNRKKLRI